MAFVAVLINFFLKHWQKIIVGIAAAWILNSAYGIFIDWVDGRENQQIVECNAEQLQTQVDTLTDQLRIAKEDAERNSAELVLMKEEAEDRAEYINRLTDILNNNSIPDDELSPKTKELWRQLNEQAKVIRNESTVSGD